MGRGRPVNRCLEIGRVQDIANLLTFLSCSIIGYGLLKKARLPATLMMSRCPNSHHLGIRKSSVTLLVGKSEQSHARSRASLDTLLLSPS